MPVRIEDVQNSKSGKSYRVRLGDQWFGAYLTYKDQPNIMTAVGRMVEVETETKEKVGPWIMAWRFSMDQTLPAGARPITPHQGAAPRELPAVPPSANVVPTAKQHGEPARQLSAEELKVVNGIVMGMVQHWNFGDTQNSFASALMQIQTAMKAIAQTVREL